MKYEFNPDVLLVIRTVFKDDTISEMLTEVEDNREILYKDGDIIRSVSGRISDLEYSVVDNIRKKFEPRNVKSYFTSNVRPLSITVDSSTDFHSDTTNILTKNIIESTDFTDVAKIYSYLRYYIDTIIKDDEDQVVTQCTILENSYINGLTHRVSTKAGQKIVQGRLIAVVHDRELMPEFVVMVVEDKVIEINMRSILKIEEVIPPVDTFDDLNNIVAQGGRVLINTGKVVDPINVPVSVALYGAQAGIAAIKAEIRNKTRLSQETIFSDTFNIASGIDLDINGFTFMNKAKLSFDTDEIDLQIKNNIFTNFKATTDNDAVIRLNKNKSANLYMINNYFALSGINADTNYSMSKTLDFLGELKDGSKINFNFFEQESCDACDINIHKVEDGGTIEINNNVWEKSHNGINLSPYGAQNFTVKIEKNTYSSTIAGKSGLLRIEANSETTDMSGITVIMNKNDHNDKNHVFYITNGGTSFEFNPGNVPTVIIDGEEVDPLEYFIKEEVHYTVTVPEPMEIEEGEW